MGIPLFRRTQDQRTFMGVLNYDGVHEPLRQPGRLSQSDFIGDCVAVGERVTEIMARLTREGSLNYILDA